MRSVDQAFCKSLYLYHLQSGSLFTSEFSPFEIPTVLAIGNAGNSHTDKKIMCLSKSNTDPLNISFYGNTKS